MSNDAAAPTAENKALYEQLKKELLLALPKKRAVDKQLAQIEAQIYALEGAYLTETAAQSGGNIIQGFDGYLKAQTGGRRRHEINDADRIFSNSSLTYQKSLEFFGEGEESAATNEDAKLLTPGLTTVVVPAATRKQEQSAAQAKRERDREYQRKKRANGNRRSADVASDEEVVPTTGRRGTKRTRTAEDD